MIPSMDEQPPDAETSQPAPGRRMRRVRLVASVLAIGAALVVGAVVVSGAVGDDTPGPVVARQDPLLPDLAMGPIEDIAVGTTEDGEEQLRFGATIVNIGEGPLLVRADRAPIGDDEWSVDQWIAERGGGYSVRPTGGQLIFGGDGHNHWHVRQVEVHQIETLDGEVLGRLVKQGFCFFDTDAYRPELPGAPDDGPWTSKGCEGTLGMRVRMGLSIGWADEYPWNLLDERIDITGLEDGVYRIRQIADPNHEIEELDETNNETWVDIELTATADGLRETRVVEAGPAP
jgi:Lysyl oxidase